MTTPSLAVLIAATAAVLLGCGVADDPAGGPDSGPGGGADARAGTGRYFPIDVGASWSYRVEKNGASIGIKTQTVEALEDIGGSKAGVTAYRLRTEKPTAKTTISWQEDTGAALIRHREQTFAADQTQETEEIYSPGKLRIDEAQDHVAAGAVFTMTYTENIVDYTLGGVTTNVDKTERWEVEAIDVPVTVPAGTFDCIQLHRTSATTASDKRYWFARGVGKVREEGGGQTELLMGYTLP